MNSIHILIQVWLTLHVIVDLQSNSALVTLDKDELTTVIEAYISENDLDMDEGFILVQSQITKESEKYLITEVYNRSEYYNFPPSFVTLVRKKPVLIYTGIEHTIKFSSNHLTAIDNLCYKFSNDDLWEKYDTSSGLTLISAPITSHLPLWVCTFKENSLMSLEKDASNYLY